MDGIQSHIYFCLRLFLTGFLSGFLVSCQFGQLPVIQPNTGSDLKEARLGESNYYLLLPDRFELSEARGKEGQLGYNIMPGNPSSTMFGFIEIRRGQPIGDPLSVSRTAKAFAKSAFLDKEIPWTINKTETGYFEAFTTENGDLNARVSSKNREEIDVLISIIATLKKK